MQCQYGSPKGPFLSSRIFGPLMSRWKASEFFSQETYTPESTNGWFTWKYPQTEKEKHLQTNHQFLGSKAVSFRGCFKSLHPVLRRSCFLTEKKNWEEKVDETCDLNLMKGDLNSNFHGCVRVSYSQHSPHPTKKKTSEKYEFAVWSLKHYMFHHLSHEKNGSL